MSKLTLSFKGMELKVIPLTGGEMIIGSAPDCGIHIDSLAVQPRHACVITRENDSTVRDLGTAEGTFVNNEKVNERALKDGDVIRVGKHTLTFAYAPPAPSVTPAPVAAPEPPADEPPPEPFTSHRVKNAWLQIMSGQNVGKNISLNRKLTNLGTPGIQTAVIAKRNDGYFLSHLEGEFPPKIGDTSIGDKSWPLQDGDIIQIGNVRMQFYYE